MALKYAVNNSLSAITSLPSGISGGALNLISTQTASASPSIEFSLDDSYDSYIFKFYDIHPSAEGSGIYFEFNFSTDGGSNYNVAKTSTYIEVFHDEADTSTALQYSTAHDLAQGTGFQRLITGLGNDNDQGNAGYMQIFNPSSTTYVKHFISNMNRTYFGDYTGQDLIAGYGNTTSPITNLKFQMNSGNIDAGIIKMYGVS